jgi:hypothetical protein
MATPNSQPLQAPATANEDVHMSNQEEESKNESPEIVRQRILKKYEKLLEEDVKSQEQMPQQAPHSRAYQSLCPFKMAEANGKNQEEISKSSKTPEYHIKELIRKNLCETGFPSAKVDECVKSAVAPGEDLFKAYYDMLKGDIKDRLRDDKDYGEARDKKIYDCLDKL